MNLVELFKLLAAWRKLRRQFKDSNMGNYINTNSIHNIFNVAGWVLGLLGVILVYSGCTALPNGNYDCTASTTIPPSWLPIIIMVTTLMSFTKTIMNLVRDGLGGLFKVQPPVASANVQVNQPINAPAGTEAKVKTETVVTGGKKS